MEDIKGIVLIVVVAGALLYAGIWDRHHRKQEIQTRMFQVRIRNMFTIRHMETEGRLAQCLYAKGSVTISQTVDITPRNKQRASMFRILIRKKKSAI